MLALGVVYHASAGFLPPYWQFSRAFLPDAAPFFALGLASPRYGCATATRSRSWVCLVTVCGLGLLSGVVSRALIPIGWTVVLLAQRNPRMALLPKLLDSRIAQYLGAISYPLYLLNQPVQRACAMLIAPWLHGDASLFTVLWLPAALSVPVLAAMALHTWIEAPAMKLGSRRSRGLPLLPIADAAGPIR